MPHAARNCLVAMTGAALVVPAMAGAAGAAPTDRAVSGGKSVITYDGDLHTAAKKAGITIDSTGSASDTKKALTLKITGGTSNDSDYVLEHGGGIELDKGEKSVHITDIKFVTAKHEATGTVSGHGKVIVFVLGDPNRGGGGPHFVEFAGYTVTFSAKLQKIADKVLDTKVFDKHSLLGAGDTTVRFSD